MVVLTVGLRVVEGPGRGEEVVVSAEGLVIGRASPEVEGRLGGDLALSRRHASLRPLDDDRLLVEDLGSTNGTYVNNEAVQRARVVEAGDVLQLGGSVIQVVVVPEETLATVRRPMPAATPGGVVVEGGVHADREGVAAGRDIHGGVHRQTVQADRGGSAAGRDIYHQERYYDASGLGLITQTRGFPRVLIVVGTLLSLAGFVSFAYPIVRAVTEGFQSGPSGSGPTFHVVPWLPLGAALMFVGIVVSTIGVLSIRRRRD